MSFENGIYNITNKYCGLLTMCVALCTASVRAWQNPLPQTAHLKGLSLEWMYLKNKTHLNSKFRNLNIDN